jgi:hypothetical protein
MSWIPTNEQIRERAHWILGENPDMAYEVAEGWACLQAQMDNAEDRSNILMICQAKGIPFPEPTEEDPKETSIYRDYQNRTRPTRVLYPVFSLKEDTK